MEKESIKISFRFFWEGFNPENNIFTNLLKKKYNVIISDSSDYVFFSVFTENSPKKQKQSIF